MSAHGSGGRDDHLTHLDAEGQAHMVDVGDKPVTRRRAVASAVVTMSPTTARLLSRGELPKGDALPVVRMAAIQAAKATPSLVPLCHHVALTSLEVDVAVDVSTGRATITATALATDRTGVEMEAMTAASVGGLVLYDLVKAVQRDVEVTRVRLLSKSGGRSGEWQADKPE